MSVGKKSLLFFPGKAGDVDEQGGSDREKKRLEEGGEKR